MQSEILTLTFWHTKYIDDGKKVTFLPNTKPSKPPHNQQPKLLQKYSQRTKEQYIPPNNQSISYNNQQIPQYTPQYNNHPYSHPQLYKHLQFRYNSSEYDQQHKLHSEPILSIQLCIVKCKICFSHLHFVFFIYLFITC